MIKTPVSTYFDKDVYPYPQIDDADSNFISECNKEDTAKEIVKRINMHDELVKSLQEVKDFTDWFYSGRLDGNRPKKPLNEIAKNIIELLGRCK